MTSHSFIAVTPLHVMISISLIRQLGLNNSARLKIVDTFAGADSVYRRMRVHKWDLSNVDISFFPSKRRAYLSSTRDGTTKLYSDSDASFQTYLDQIWMKVLSPSMDICVYEDGVGSYRTDLYSGFKKRIFDTLGVGTFLGGLPFTNAMFVYERGRYIDTFPHVKARVVEIQESLSDFIAQNKSDLCYIFDYKPDIVPDSDECTVYLSSWDIDVDFIESLSDSNGDVFIKLHPHIKDFDIDLDLTFLKQSVPAEIVLADLSTRYRTVKVFHHWSSVHQYISHSNIEFVEI